MSVSPEILELSRRKLGVAHGVLDISVPKISEHFAAQTPCPLYPRKRTFAVHKLMSALGQERTLAAQQNILFDDLIGATEQRS